MKEWKKYCWHIERPNTLQLKHRPYSLGFGVEPVLPLKCQILFLWVAIQEGLNEEENDWLHLDELEEHEEKSLDSEQNFKFNQARLSRGFNKNVHLRCF